MEQNEKIPVRLYEDGNRVMMAAPMPGLQAENIRVKIEGNRLIVHGEQRGPAVPERSLLLDEWTPGPYHREVELPQPVDGSLANATYGNGVLVLSLPKAQANQPGTPAEFQLKVTEATRGEHIRHTGAGASMRPDRGERNT